MAEQTKIMPPSAPPATGAAETPAVPQNTVGLERNITDTVLNRINAFTETGALTLPPNYSAGNALKAAWLKLQEVKDKNQNLALNVCTKNSIANALFDMAVQGLSPAKTQCYFIVRGNELTLMRSYFGTCAVLKRLEGVEDVYAQVVYEGDIFEYAIKDGNIAITRHEQKIGNINPQKIIGAYSVIIKDGEPHCEVMTKAQIDMSWSKRSNNGQVQKDFPEEMSKRTVINRGAKMFVNTSDDSDILCYTINKTTEGEYENVVEVVDDVANKEPLALPTAPSAPESKQKPSEPSFDIPTEGPGF